MAEFMAANTFSIGVLTANPSNVILGEVIDIDFIEYLKIMLLDGIVVGICCSLYSYLLLKILLIKQ